MAEAEPLYVQALALQPANYPALHLMGLLRLQQDRLPEAIALMEKALKLQPNAPETLTNYAMALKASGRNAEALKTLDKDVTLRPRHARSWANRGTVLVRMGRDTEALADFTRAAEFDPRNFEIQNNRALALKALRRFEAAAEAFDVALALKPGDADARNNRGICLRETGRPAAALADFERALKLAPGNPGVLLNRANTLWTLGREDEALACYDAILAAHPNLAEAHMGRGGLLAARKQLAAAIASLEAAVRLSPDLPYLRGNLLHQKMVAGDWRGFDEARAALDLAIRAGRQVAEPYTYQALTDSPADLQACCRLFTENRFPARAPLFSARSRKPGKIRVGYVAGEFHNHATTILSIGLYEHHDRERFEIFAFDNAKSDGSALRTRFEAAVPAIVPIAGLSDQDAAQRIRAADIDILVNLNGHVGMLRTGIFAQRPAPLQVSYLGFPGTMGAPYMDYILADGVLIGADDAGYYDEKIAWLPDSYQINDDKRSLPQPTIRAAHALPDNAFVFCQFNAPYKTTPEMFAVWMRLLAGVENSVLWLMAGNDLFPGNLRRAAAAQGIDPARLIFAGKVPNQEHLARLPLADLFLDSAPCSAHTTASDALWTGLPLLTCRGHSFASRVAASLLLAAGLPELVTDTLADYENLALALARDPARLRALRDRLAANRRTCALFDTAATTRQIESAYVSMLERWIEGAPPASFHVPR